jgi:hypothetical protein
MMTANFWKVNVVSVIIKGNAYSGLLHIKKLGDRSFDPFGFDDVVSWQCLYYVYKNETIPSDENVAFQTFIL